MSLPELEDLSSPLPLDYRELQMAIDHGNLTADPELRQYLVEAYFGLAESGFEPPADFRGSSAFWDAVGQLIQGKFSADFVVILNNNNIVAVSLTFVVC